MITKQIDDNVTAATCDKCGKVWDGKSLGFVFFDLEEMDGAYDALCLKCAELECDPELSYRSEVPEDECPEDSPCLDPPWWAYK